MHVDRREVLLLFSNTLTFLILHATTDLEDIAQTRVYWCILNILPLKTPQKYHQLSIAGHILCQCESEFFYFLWLYKHIGYYSMDVILSAAKQKSVHFGRIQLHENDCDEISHLARARKIRSSLVKWWLLEIRNDE